MTPTAKLTLLIFVIVLILLISYYVSRTYYRKIDFRSIDVLSDGFVNTTRPRSNPKQIHMTYPNKAKIPDYVYQNLDRYARGYSYKIYDDTDCLEFLGKYFEPIVTETYHNLAGAHRADLFRYCVLYVQGGVYLDIKTELIRPLDEVFTDPTVDIYTSLSIKPHSIYQGVIYAPHAANPIFLDLIKYMTARPWWISKIDYHVYTKDFYKLIHEDIGRKPVRPGKLVGENATFYLFQEKEVARSECPGGVDRYGLCVYIFDGEEKMIKTRFAQYPW